jgi:antitoxin HicB
MANKKHVGSKFADFLKEEGIYEDVQKLAAKKRLVIQIVKEMKKQKITKTEMASRMNTSRGQVNRILSPFNTAVSVDTLERAAEVLGCHIKLELVPG